MKLIDKIKKNKLLYFLGVLIVGIFIVLIVRFTYAYLAANVNEARGDVSVDSDETDNLKFAVGDPLSIDATPTTLPENGENLVDTTTATATLLANSTNNTAEYPYWVYFTISNNTFVYSDGSTPEIILTVTDPEGNPVTNIDGLTYGTFNGVAGFDVTAQNGKFTVANGYTITSNSSTDATEQTWNFTLTYLNLPTDQSANFGNSMTTEVSMSKEEAKPLFADYIISLYSEDGVNDLYYHDGSGTYGTLEAGDNSYRYTGANPNNYVCFGSTENPCSEENLYRIIGVFDDDKDSNYQIKLIKNDYGSNYADSYYTTQNVNQFSEYYRGSLEQVSVYFWGVDTLEGTWEDSRLNFAINDFYQSDLISLSEWQIGGNTWDNIGLQSIKQVFQNEIVNPENDIKYSAKIGLMYVSDYGYAASPENWNVIMENLNTVDNRDGNWMFMGLDEWTITKQTNTDVNDVFLIERSGRVYDTGDDLLIVPGGVRPCFYLETSVKFVGGSGSFNNPYIID